MQDARLYPVKKDYRVGVYKEGKRIQIIPCTDENEVRDCTQMLESQHYAVRLRVGATPPANLESEDSNA